MTSRGLFSGVHAGRTYAKPERQEAGDLIIGYLEQLGVDGEVATEHDLDPPLATLMVAVGLIISFATLTIWWWLMQGV